MKWLWRSLFYCFFTSLRLFFAMPISVPLFHFEARLLNRYRMKRNEPTKRHWILCALDLTKVTIATATSSLTSNKSSAAIQLIKFPFWPVGQSLVTGVSIWIHDVCDDASHTSTNHSCENECLFARVLSCSRSFYFVDASATKSISWSSCNAHVTSFDA